MQSSRLPRFSRANVTPIHLTSRDLEIIKLVYQHRFLRSSHICALASGSPQQIQRRLKLLFHHGYLERPRAQIDYYHKGGSREMVYGLGNKGGSLLRQELGINFRELSWGEKNRSVGRIYLEHAVLVSDVMVAIQLACRNSGIRFLTERALLPAETSERWFEWRVNIGSHAKLGVVPDRVFALEFNNHRGDNERLVFFLEADRGTMPVIRKNLLQTSFYRKLLAYEATWSQSIHTTRFGFNRFRVLTVTTSAKRVNSLLEACSKLQRGRGLFLFADKSILKNPDTLLSAVWRSGSDGKVESLVSELQHVATQATVSSGQTINPD